MFYRKLPHGGEAISVIGLGASSLHEAGKDAVRVVEAALDAGVNYIDLAAAKRASVEAVASALWGRRRDAMLQVHFGALYDGEDYGMDARSGRHPPHLPVGDGDARPRIRGLWLPPLRGRPEDADAVGLSTHDPAACSTHLRALKAEGRVRHIGVGIFLARSAIVPAACCPPAGRSTCSCSASIPPTTIKRANTASARWKTGARLALHRRLPAPRRAAALRNEALCRRPAFERGHFALFGHAGRSRRISACNTFKSRPPHFAGCSPCSPACGTWTISKPCSAFRRQRGRARLRRHQPVLAPAGE